MVAGSDWLLVAEGQVLNVVQYALSIIDESRANVAIRVTWLNLLQLVIDHLQGLVVRHLLLGLLVVLLVLLADQVRDVRVSNVYEEARSSSLRASGRVSFILHSLAEIFLYNRL